MGLISSRQYDKTMRFFSDVARKIRTSPPIKAVRKIHTQSFEEVQQIQSEIERYYNIQYQPSRTKPPTQSPQTEFQRRPLPAGRPQPLPPANRQPLGQFPPYRPNQSHPNQSRPNQSRPIQPRSERNNPPEYPRAQQPTKRTQQPPRDPQRPEWQQRRPEDPNPWQR